MDELTALAILANTLETCLNTDLGASEAFAALSFLAARVPVKWPSVEFRQGLDSGDENRSSSNSQLCLSRDQVTPQGSATIKQCYASSSGRC
jgi:hypothetical protein